MSVGSILVLVILFTLVGIAVRRAWKKGAPCSCGCGCGKCKSCK